MIPNQEVVTRYILPEERETLPTEFDEAMRAVKPGSVVYLAPGDHYTQGYRDGEGWVLPANCALIGAGMGITRLHLINPKQASWNVAIFTGWTAEEDTLAAGRVLVEGLTIDCHGTFYDEFCLGGVHAFGQSVVIRDVEVLRGVGLRGKDEAHQILGSTPAGPGSRGHVRIENCRVANFAGRYSMGIAAYCRNVGMGLTGRISGCLVDYSTLQDSTGAFGLGVSGTRGFLLDGNVVIGAGRGFNWDTGNGSGVRLIGNTFEDCQGQGVFLGAGFNGIVRDNVIMMKPGTAWPGMAGIHMQAEPPCDPAMAGWTVAGNLISGPAGVPAIRCPDKNLPPRLRIQGNIASQGMLADMPKGKFAAWDGNVAGAATLKPRRTIWPW